MAQAKKTTTTKKAVKFAKEEEVVIVALNHEKSKLEEGKEYKVTGEIANILIEKKFAKAK